MITIGAKARFCPACSISVNDSRQERAAKMVTGTIVYVNWRHRVFSVEWTAGNTRQIEAFKFWDIGKTVNIL